MRTPFVPTNSRKPLLVVILAAVALVLTGFLVGYVQRPLPLYEHARILYQAILDEDGATILSYVHPADRELNNLTPEITAALVSEMINARYEAWGWTPDGKVNAFAADTLSNSAIADQLGRIPRVGREARGIQIWQFDGLADGRPVFSLSNRIVTMWGTEGKWSLRRQGKPRDEVIRRPEVLARAWAEGLRRDGSRLEQLGIRYRVRISIEHGEVRVLTFENAQQVFSDLLATPEAIFARDPTKPHPVNMRHRELWMTVDQALAHKQQAQGR